MGLSFSRHRARPVFHLQLIKILSLFVCAFSRLVQHKEKIINRRIFR
jgi:hypothetical protein